MRRLVTTLALQALLLAACRKEPGTVLIVNVNLASGSVTPAPTTALHVTVEAGARWASSDFHLPDRGPLHFPTNLTVELPRDIAGQITLAVRAVDKDGQTTAAWVRDLPLVPGQQQSVDVLLACPGTCPTGDAGASDGPGPPGADAGSDAGDAGRQCGNGVLDPGESCDPAIAAMRPGACPASCDDGLYCTNDSMVGSGCDVQCVHREIGAVMPNDRCCPAGANFTTDPDCSATCGEGAIQPGETCDTGIPPGKTGACPTGDDCVSKDPCVRAVLVSAQTCSAVCARETVTASISGDGCCPAGANSASDADCPVVCGNGMLETDAGETCDPGIAPPAKGSCPTSCNDDNPCTKDVLEGSGCRVVCRFRPITELKSADGCCPAGGNRNVDSDCPALCGNSVVEAGEACDNAIAAGKEGACPTACPEDATGCMARRLDGRSQDCTARCVVSPVTACVAKQKDGCCPGGCKALDDPDCSASCGNMQVEPGETCDTGIADGEGRCPSTCADGDACTTDALVSRGTCSATCHFVQITTFVSDDMCCPSGGNATLDNDCAPVCGNRVVEGPSELCDKGIAAGEAGACPNSCPLPPLCSRNMLVGNTEECTARCATEPITECRAGDGCCPHGCDKSNDGDCPAVCGNGVLEPGESCDRGITAGHKGACAATCDDNDACTNETTSGRVEDCTRVCARAPIVACTTGDRCCPVGCQVETDADCSASCGNGIVETKETCDPPGSCPTTCPDDGDACTGELLIGDPSKCTADCAHLPITMCSATSDGCCPTGCTTKDDLDCPSGLNNVSPLQMSPL